MTTNRRPQNMPNEALAPDIKLLKNSELEQAPGIEGPKAEIISASNNAVLNTHNDEQSLRNEKIRFKNLEHQLTQLTDAIESGQIQKALKLERHLQQRANTLPPSLLKSLTAQSKALRELQDWQIYATIPKRQALCDEMTILVGDQSIAASQKAKQIKALQDQWKQLGASDSKPAQILWHKFKRLSERAFQPCAHYFKKQKNIRTMNLAEKEKICIALDSLVLDIKAEKSTWQTKDWKNLTTLISEVQKEWQRFNDIPRSKYKSLQQRYKNILDRLYNEVKTEKYKNHQLKSDLIKKVACLIELDVSLPQKTEETKKIQTQWTKIGITERNVDQKLWKDFRIECDKIFALRSEASILIKQRFDDETTQAESLIKELQHILEGDGILDEELFKEITRKYQHIPLGSRQKHLNAQFQALSKTITSTIKTLHLSSQKIMLTEVKRKAKLCVAHELKEAKMDKIITEWENGFSLPDNLQVAMTKRLKNSQEPNLTILEQLCVKLEMLANIASPESSQSTKMAYQVERLNKELSNRQKETRSLTEQVQEIQIQWYSQVTCIEAKNIVKRFVLAENKLGV